MFQFIIWALIIFGIGMGIRALVKRKKKVQPAQVSSAPIQPTPVSSPPATGNSNFCPQCGTRLDAGSAFCGKCGTKIPQ